MFRQGAGSGFIISQDGLIVTNAHVVQSARKGVVDVEMVNGKKYKGVIQVIDSVSDLALVKIEEVCIRYLKAYECKVHISFSSSTASAYNIDMPFSSSCCLCCHKLDRCY